MRITGSICLGKVMSGSIKIGGKLKALLYKESASHKKNSFSMSY
jgi:hypothetical protein